MSLKKNRIVTLASLSNKAFGKYRKQIIVLVTLGFFGGFLEGIGVNALIPLFSFAIGDGQNGGDLISQAIEKFFGVIALDFSVTYLLVFIIILFILRALIKVYIDYLKIKITADYENEARSLIFNKILKSDWPYLIQQKLGHLENIMLLDVPHGGMILRHLSTAIMTITSLLVYLLVAINIDLTITLATLTLGLIIFLVLKPLNYKTKILSKTAVGQNKSMSHHITENILGIKTIKSLHVVEGVEDKARLIFFELRNIKIKLFVIKSVVSSFMQPVGIIFICLIFAFTYQLPSFNLVGLIVIVYLIQKIFTYIQQLQHTLNDINEQLPYLKSSLSYQDQAIKNEEVDTGQESFLFKKELAFKNVYFKYENTKDNKTIFDGINFSIKKGEMVGIIGPSGVGKTTLVDLVLRLLKPQSGSITLDDKDIATISLKSWRENIGYVSQDMFLINNTIANNIKFYNNSISQDKLIEAAKMANIYDFIQTLPDKFETNIGERGIRLSVGQRQRIAIARVLARDPQILVLDEATSALDNESELQIQKVIQGLRGRITVLAIAHRLTTVKDSDKLVVLDDGKIREQGTPAELFKDKQSYFSKVYNLRQ